MLPSRQSLFQRRPCVFQQDNAKPHTSAIATAWLRSRRVRVLNWPACSPYLLRTFGAPLNEKYVKDDHEFFSSWKPKFWQEWDQIPTPKLQKLITSMLQTVLKRRRDATPW